MSFPNSQQWGIEMMAESKGESGFGFRDSVRRVCCHLDKGHILHNQAKVVFGIRCKGLILAYLELT